MPRIESGGSNKWLWGCSCPAFRAGEPDAVDAIKALVRALDVKTQCLGAFRDGSVRYQAWTNPDQRYVVVRATLGEQPGGFCKHIAACMMVGQPEMEVIAGEIIKALDDVNRLEKTVKKLEKERDRWEKNRNNT